MRVVWGLLIAMTGAVLAFAVTADVYTIHAIGWILLLAGLFCLGLGVVRGRMPRRREVQVRAAPGRRRNPVQHDSGE